MPQIPVTVFTGFLGSGKTTIIRNLIKQLPSDYNMCLLKNEYGDINVDSLLLSDSNIQVTEMINGCLCCVLVGKLEYALLELLSKYNPKRIIIESSGSAFPAPIALEINKLNEKLKLDGIINVVDVINFESYKDTSYTAKIQSQFTDLIVLNKHELADNNRFERVIDSLNDLNSSTPKIKSSNGFVDKSLLLGIDSKLIINSLEKYPNHLDEFDVIQLKLNDTIKAENIAQTLNVLPKWDFYRIKGYISNKGVQTIYNYVLGKWNILTTKNNSVPDGTHLLFIGKNLKYHSSKISKELGIKLSKLTILTANTH